MNIINSKYIKNIFVMMLCLLGGHVAMAQGETSSLSPEDMSLVIIAIVLVIMILVLFVAFYLLQTLRAMVRDGAMRKAKDQGVKYIEEPSAWATFYDSLTDAVPISNESSIELDHNYDGIRELDNHLPPWWKYLFYATIVWGIGYVFLYHISGTLPLQAEEYEIAMAEAAANIVVDESASSIDEANIVFSDDPAVLASGKKDYDRNCVACHKANGEGGIGPNLADSYWLHGGSSQDIYNSIKNGIPDKGMIAWGDLISPSKMNDIVSYIHTMKGTNPENAKAAQGDLYEGE